MENKDGKLAEAFNDVEKTMEIINNFNTYKNIINNSGGVSAVAASNNVISLMMQDSNWRNAIYNSECLKTTPIMASVNTKSSGTYSGEVIGNINSTQYSRAMYKAFDKQITTRLDGYVDYGCGNYGTGISSTSCWIGFHFTDTSMKLVKWSVALPQRSLNDNCLISKVKLYGSNDGTNFIALSDEEDVSNSNILNTYYLDEVTDSYSYFKVEVVEANTNNNICIDEVEFYGF